MSTHLPGFWSFFRLFALFGIPELATISIKVNGGSCSVIKCLSLYCWQISHSFLPAPSTSNEKASLNPDLNPFMLLKSSSRGGCLDL